MGLAGFGVESLADDLVIADEDATNHGVRAGVAGRLPRQLDAPAHVVGVHVCRLRPAPHDTPGAAANRDAGAASGGCGGGGSRGERGGHVSQAQSNEM